MALPLDTAPRRIRPRRTVGIRDHPLTPGEQLVYFQIRGGTIDVMVESLQALGDPSIDVDAAVVALGCGDLFDMN